MSSDSRRILCGFVTLSALTWRQDLRPRARPKSPPPLALTNPRSHPLANKCANSLKHCGRIVGIGFASSTVNSKRFSPADRSRAPTHPGSTADSDVVWSSVRQLTQLETNRPKTAGSTAARAKKPHAIPPMGAPGSAQPIAILAITSRRRVETSYFHRAPPHQRRQNPPSRVRQEP